MSERGLLIVLEGVEGVGKTTQWHALGARLRNTGKPLVAVREPGGTDVGDAIRHVLLDAPLTVSDRTEAMLFAASRAQIIFEVIMPALEHGDDVLLDRFLLSTYAYQGAGRGIDMASLRSINSFATRGITPDITLLLTMPLEAALHRATSRSASDRIEREDRAFHARVARSFDKATSPEWQAQYPECGEIVPVDANGTAGEVTQRCVSELARRWPARFSSLLDHDSPSTIGMHA